MSQWTGFEVHGHSVTRMLEASNPFSPLAHEVLRGAGIFVGNVDNQGIPTDAWYPLPVALRLFERIGQTAGEAAVRSIGASVPGNAPFPKAHDIASALAVIDVAYHMNHRFAGEPLYDIERNETLPGVGGYGCQRLGQLNVILSVCDNPYPCVFDQGLLLRVAQRFQPAARLYHLNGGCRREHDAQCVYCIAW